MWKDPIERLLPLPELSPGAGVESDLYRKANGVRLGTVLKQSLSQVIAGDAGETESGDCQRHRLNRVR